MPQELRKLSKDKAIVVKQGIDPAYCEKAFYYKEPVFLNRLASVSKEFTQLVLNGGKPTFEQIVELRAKGAFSATLATAPFTPFTHSRPGDDIAEPEIPNEISSTKQFTVPEFTLAEAAFVLSDRIPEFSATATTQDWMDIVYREAVAVFSHIEEGASE